jgi:hypothetical protein
MSKRKFTLAHVAAIALWLITIVLAVADVYFLQQLFFAFFSRLSNNGQTMLVVGDVLAVLGAMLALAVIVLTSEYQLRHLGEHRAWDALAWTLVGLLAIPALLAAFLV